MYAMLMETPDGAVTELVNYFDIDTDKTVAFVERIFIDSWCALTLAIKVNDLHVRMLDDPRTIDLFQFWYACMQGDVQSLANRGSIHTPTYGTNTIRSPFSLHAFSTWLKGTTFTSCFLIPLIASRSPGISASTC